MFTSPSQILCTVCGVHIYYYGVILALAIMTGTLVSEYISEKVYKLKSSHDNRFNKDRHHAREFAYFWN